MNIPVIFHDHKKRNLILWLTDMTMAIVSYFYVTDPFYFQSVMNRIDFATLRPDMDPALFQSPMFFEFMFQVMSVVSVITIGIIVLFHSLAFYRCYLRKSVAIAYVKIYSFLAAVSLMVWFIYNIELKNILILIPAAIYTLVFFAEKQNPTVLPIFNSASNEKSEP